MRTLVLLFTCACLLAGCTFITLPSKGNGKGFTYVHYGKVSTATLPTVLDTPKKVVNSCDLYIPPKHEAPPEVPNFTQAEQHNPDQLNLRLGRYIQDLRTYIRETSRKEQDAYQTYLKRCKQGQ